MEILFYLNEYQKNSTNYSSISFPKIHKPPLKNSQFSYKTDADVHKTEKIETSQKKFKYFCHHRKIDDEEKGVLFYENNNKLFFNEILHKIM